MAVIYRYFDPENPRNPRKKIMILGDSSYVTDIESMLDDPIYWSYMGRAVLREIWHSPYGRSVSIQFEPGVWHADVEDDPATAKDERLDGWAGGEAIPGSSERGTGMGASSSLVFDPITRIPSALCPAGHCVNPRFNEAKFVLFHELVHAMRHVTGKWRHTMVTMNGHPNTPIEEGVAILIANVLMSEKGANELRKHMNSLDTMGPDPFSYMSDSSATQIIDMIQTDHFVLFSSIARLKQDYFLFNPFYVRENIDITQLAGQWTVRVDKWTWIYDFDGGGGVRWTDPYNGMTGWGSWKLANDHVSVSWAPGSKTTEKWNLPLNPPSQIGTCFMPPQTFPLAAERAFGPPLASSSAVP